MRIVRRVFATVVAGLLCLSLSQTQLGGAAPDAPTADAKVVLQDISYDALCKLVRDNKGKVIVVDFWGEY